MLLSNDFSAELLLSKPNLAYLDLRAMHKARVRTGCRTGAIVSSLTIVQATKPSMWNIASQEQFHEFQHQHGQLGKLLQAQASSPQQERVLRIHTTRKNTSFLPSPL